MWVVRVRNEWKSAALIHSALLVYSCEGTLRDKATGWLRITLCESDEAQKHEKLS